MLDSLKQKWVYGSGLAFIGLAALFLYFEILWFLALPVALVIVYLALFRLHWLMLLIVFVTPISITIDNVGGGFGLTLPTDPLMFGAMLVFLFKVFYDHRYDMRIVRHPISIAIFINLIWMFLTSITSELPLVSFKFLISRLWFVVTFYFIAVQMFRYRDLLIKYFWMYIIPMTFVIIYTMSRQYVRAFDEKAAHWVMTPFFNDHTSYGAMIAMFIPLLFNFMFDEKFKIDAKIVSGFFFFIFLIGLIMSYTRAAWVSVVAAIFLAIFIKLRIRWWILSLLGVTLVALFFSFQSTILQELEKNRQDSSGNLAEHVQSITNVATDASNLERINRWKSAFRMFAEDPVMGKGPGTYAFLYAPYQHSSDLTIISTNFGDLGTAHSEYFGPLAEQGVMGMLTFLLIVFMLYHTGIPLYYKLKHKRDRAILMSVILGLTTYLTHGILNNFLDTDKASVPFWGFLAVIVVMDLYCEKNEPEAEKTN